MAEGLYLSDFRCGFKDFDIVACEENGDCSSQTSKSCSGNNHLFSKSVNHAFFFLSFFLSLSVSQSSAQAARNGARCPPTFSLLSSPRTIFSVTFT
jgi:hypothetical protein